MTGTGLLGGGRTARLLARSFSLGPQPPVTVNTAVKTVSLPVFLNLTSPSPPKRNFDGIMERRDNPHETYTTGSSDRVLQIHLARSIDPASMIHSRFLPAEPLRSHLADLHALPDAFLDQNSAPRQLSRVMDSEVPTV